MSKNRNPGRRVERRGQGSRKTMKNSSSAISSADRDRRQSLPYTDRAGHSLSEQIIENWNQKVRELFAVRLRDERGENR
jgi:hypothetical protein